MLKKLTQIGNSLGIIIEKPILELLEIDRETEMEVRTDGTGLVLRPVRSDRRERVRRLTEHVMDAHDDAFRRLSR